MQEIIRERLVPLLEKTVVIEVGEHAARHPLINTFGVLMIAVQVKEEPADNEGRVGVAEVVGNDLAERRPEANPTPALRHSPSRLRLDDHMIRARGDNESLSPVDVGKLLRLL